MINFRFHLVSLVAVFLALTVGIVVGASIVNRAIVDGLNDRIDRVEKNADTQRGQNRALSASSKQLESSLETSAPYVVEGRLTAVPIAVVAERGVDHTAVRNEVTLLQDAGAQAPAIVWLESKWLLNQPAQRSALAAIVGDVPTDPNLRTDALAALAHRLSTAVPTTTVPTTAPAKSATTVTTAASRTTDVLSALTTAGFVSVESVGASGSSDLSTFPSADARASVIGGEASDLITDPLVKPLASAFAAIEVPTVASEVYHATNGQPPRGAVVAPIRTDDALSKQVSTVDDLDLVQGQVAGVLAAADAGEAKVGHYGYGAGAKAAMPAWSGP